MPPVPRPSRRSFVRLFMHPPRALHPPLTTKRDVAIAVAVAAVVAAVFWVPAIPAAHGWFPAPLDDVYIHFDFARSFGQGHPFEWIPGQGYSSGETSPLYAFVLGVGWAVGFRGAALGIFAGFVAIGAVASLIGSVRRLVHPCPTWLGWIVALFPLAIGIVDWALFSGMEVAVFVAVLARALEAVDRLTRGRPGGPRERRQWTLGLWGAALVLLRPEGALLVAIFAFAAATTAGNRSALAVLFRVALPGALATVAVLGSNFLATGDPRSAGAQLKLLSSNPYMSDIDRARVFAENLVTFWIKVVRGELAVRSSLLAVLPVLAVLGLFVRDRRRVVATTILAALGWTLLVSWNGNAPYHNFRYYAPALVLLAIAAAIGAAAIARIDRGRRRWGRALGGFVAVATLAIVAARVPAQVRHFRASTANIRDQHIEVGTRIARSLPAEARILLGDAGAIPYVSNRAAVDALGLGGYRGVPFARAAVHGEPATIELIERLAPEDRPTHFALYPNWFGSLTSRFGTEIDRVTIQGNIICGGSTKAIYRADWSALAVPGAPRGPEILDELDVGDVLDEEAHGYTPPLPHGGWTTLDVLDDGAGRRFDGGRTIPADAEESFTLRAGANGPLLLRLRIDGGARGIALRTARDGLRELTLEPPSPGAWRTASIALDGIDAGERVAFVARGGEYRNYHVWVERSPAVSRR